MEAASMPCLRALNRGPVDVWALARFAVICAGVAMTTI